MKPLFVLWSASAVALLVIKGITHQYNFALAARIGLSVMLVFTAIAHVIYTRGMAMMIPSFIPFKTELVYLTGLAELILAIGLLIPSLSYYCGWFLIGFLLCLLPANINAAIHHIDYQKATLDGHGLNYLWFRVPLQMVFIGWTYFSTLFRS